jgi:ABC-type bacteriocin/lantibiotic exporter with double-glycine peptidase domain
MIPIRLEKFYAVKQKDDRSCGLCSVSSVYKFHQLSPERYGLRERLGIDNNALPLGGLDTRGMLPMDMLSVLHEDGFDAEWIAGSYESYSEDLRRHLKAGHPALALVDVFAHWVVIVGIDDDGISIADSSGYLAPRGKNRHRYEITQECASDRISGVILVSRARHARSRKMKPLDFVERHVSGAVFGVVGGVLYGVRALKRWLKQ